MSCRLGELLLQLLPVLKVEGQVDHLGQVAPAAIILLQEGKSTAPSSSSTGIGTSSISRSASAPSNSGAPQSRT